MSASVKPKSPELPLVHPIEAMLRQVTTDRDNLASGTAIGSFVLRRVLERDDFSVLYLANASASSGMELGIEEFAPVALALRDDGELRARSDVQSELLAAGLQAFLEESGQLARLNHPALVRIGPVWQTRGTAFRLRLDLPGRSLVQLRAALAAPPDEAWLRRLIDPLLGALEHVHDGGLIHGNLRPGRIVVQPNGAPLLPDFGAPRRAVAALAPWLASAPEPEFQPPEMLDPARRLEPWPQSDLYALAAVLQFCITGQAPLAAARRLQGEQAPRLAQQLVELRRHSGSALYGESFITAIDRAFSLDPAERPASVKEFREDLRPRLTQAFVAPRPIEPVSVGEPMQAQQEAHASLGIDAPGPTVVTPDPVEPPAWTPAPQQPPAPGEGPHPLAPSAHWPEEPWPTQDAGEQAAATAGQPDSLGQPLPETPEPASVPMRAERDLEPQWAPVPLYAVDPGPTASHAPAEGGYDDDAREPHLSSLAPLRSAPWGPPLERRALRWPWVVGGMLVGAAFAVALALGMRNVADDARLAWLARAVTPAERDAAAGPAAEPVPVTPSAAPAVAPPTPTPAAPPPTTAAFPATTPAIGAAADATLVAPRAAAPGAGERMNAAQGAIAATGRIVGAPLAPTPAAQPGSPARAAASPAEAAAPTSPIGVPEAPAAPPAVATAPPPAAAAAPLPRAEAVAPSRSVAAPQDQQAQPRQTPPARARSRVDEAAVAARAREPASPLTPAAACAPRSNFALYQCMKTQCELDRFYAHAQCVRLRRTDEVSR